MLNSSKYIKYLIVLGSALFSYKAVASESLSAWEFNGFLTQGYFNSDYNNIYGQSEDGSFDFREIALNAAWRPYQNLMVSGQLMSRRAGKVQEGDPQVDYAMLDYRLTDGVAGRIGVRVGRIKNPLGFYNETRDVAFTRPSIMLAQAVYFDIARDLVLSSDGIGIYGSRNFNDGWLDMDLLLGKPKTEESVEYAFLSADWPGEMEDSKGFMWRTVYNTNDQRWRAGFTMGRFTLNYEADEVGLSNLSLLSQMVAPQDGQIDFDAYLLSLQYNLERWSFTTEVARQKTSWGSLQGIFGMDPVNRTEAGYLQAEYRINSRWSAVARYEKLYFDVDDRDGTKTEALTGKPAHTQFAEDFTLGIGWQPSASWLIRAEWHRVTGTAWIPEQDTPDQNTLVKKWNLYALQATFRF